MRAGRLRHRALVLELSASLSTLELGARWVDIRVKEAAEGSAPVGLRARTLVEVRARHFAGFIAGRYLAHGSRLFHITSQRDPKGNRTELILTCEELIGQPAQYTASQGDTPKPCRVHITHGVARIGEHTGRAEYWTQLEVALIEVGRPQAGAVFELGAERYRVVGLVEDDDDRVTRKLWVKKL